MNPGYGSIKQRGFLYATAVFNLAEDQNIELVEETTYDLTELIADIGGAAGLILGLNLISLITVCSKVRVRSKLRLSVINFKKICVTSLQDRQLVLLQNAIDKASHQSESRPKIESLFQ